VLLVLGEQGVAVMRQYPDTFEKISRRLGGPTSAIFLAFMRDHFEDLAKCGGLPKLLDLFEKMPEDAKAIGQEYPEAMPLLALAPMRCAEPSNSTPRLAWHVCQRLTSAEDRMACERSPA
jgi:hypothetical protein